MKTTVASSAVAAINKENLEIAEGKAIALVQSILRRQSAIKDNDSQIDSLQKEVGQLANSEITVASVMGGVPASGLHGSQSETQKTIAKVVETLVKSKQGCVENKASRLAEAIISLKAGNVELEKAIAKDQKELAELKVEVVTETDVLD